MHCDIDLKFKLKDGHNILLNKQHRPHSRVEYNHLISAGMYSFTCTETCGIIYSKPFGILRTYPFLYMHVYLNSSNKKQ